MSASIEGDETVYSTQRYFQAIAELGKLTYSRHLHTTIAQLDKHTGAEKTLEDEVDVMEKMGFVEEVESSDGITRFRPAEEYSDEFKAVADYMEKEYGNNHKLGSQVTEKEIEELQERAGFLEFLS